MAAFSANLGTVWYWGSPSYPVSATISGNTSRSGNTVTLSGMSLSLSWPPYASGSWAVSFTVNGTTTSATLAANTPTFGLNNTSLTVGATATSASIGWSSSDGYSGSFTVTFPSGATPPSGGSVTYNSCTWDSINITSSVSSWGSGYSGTPNLEQIVCDSAATSSTWESLGRQAKANATTSTTSTQSVTASNSTAYSGGVTIKGCMSFKVAMWGSTSAGNTSAFSNTVHYTPPAPLSSVTATASPSSTPGMSTVSLTITGGNSTNNYNVNVVTQYRYKYGTGSWGAWTTAGSQGSPWSSRSATFSVPYNSAVYIEARQMYQSQYSEVTSISINSGSAPLYGSVNNVARRITKLYGSVNGESREIVKLYGSVNGVAKRIF